MSLTVSDGSLGDLARRSLGSLSMNGDEGSEDRDNESDVIQVGILKHWEGNDKKELFFLYFIVTY